MFDYNIWFKGMIIENIKAETLRKAQNAAKKMFSQPVVVNAVSDTREGHMSAKAKSLAA
jgi:hypothetical protein